MAGIAALCTALALMMLAAGPAAAEPAAWTGAVADYLRTLARQDGGYAWEDQADSHLTPTFAAVGALRAIGREAGDKARRAELAEFVRTHHPLRGRKPESELHEFEFQQVQTLLWLGQDATALEPTVREWTAPFKYPPQYERHSYPVFQQELAAFVCRELLKMPTSDLSPAFIQYVDERRRPNGSFNGTPAADGSDGNVLNTWWGLRALHAVGRSDERRKEAADWLRSCQLPDGGFIYQPKAEIGRVEDVIYTWAAVRALHLLGEKPRDREGCVRFLHSLYNADGGFGDRPGWPSNPLATYYAIDALVALDALGRPPPSPRPPEKPAPLPQDLKVFTIQLESHGQGSPAEAVELARSLRIHLWGAKNAKPGWIARAQELADRRKAGVTFFVADEEYGTFMDLPGVGTYSHMSDLFAPAGVDFGPSLSGQRAWTWAEFRERRIAPLERANGRVFWQFGENEPLVRMLLDESVERGFGGLGYSAISTFHFGNPDFIGTEPFLYHYRYRLPLVSLQDAHGAEPWWFSDMTTGFRTLFLAREPTWEGWMAALKNDWVAAVRHDAVTQFRTRMHGGAPGVQQFVRDREDQWRWWDNPDIRCPAVSVVALTPQDRFEAGRPESGVAVRVRCQWNNTTQGLPKKAVTELVSLSIDGKSVEPKLVRKNNNRGVLADVYHLVDLADLAPGTHTATAVVRAIDTKAESKQTIEFTVP